MTQRIRSLSIHANYRCGHSGACCTAGWPIPVERVTAAKLREAIAAGRLQVPPDSADTEGSLHAVKPSVARVLTAAGDAPPETPAVAAMDAHGACVFYERARKRCAIHRQLGEALLPDTCRQFPRVSLLDARGLSVTLSHFCPTAARLLFEETELRVVGAPPAFPASFPFDPLDAREALPPLLHPKVLLDLDTFDRWERTVVALLSQDGRGPEQALGAVSDFTEALRLWEPGGREAIEALAHAEAQTKARRRNAEAAGGPIDARRVVDCHELVRRAIPEALRPTAMDADRLHRADARFVAQGWSAYAAPLRRYAAAKVLGSWLAYQGRGLRTIVFAASAALLLVRSYAALESERRARSLDEEALIAAVRRTDELLLHLASRQALADELSRVEASLAGPPPLGVL